MRTLIFIFFPLFLSAQTPEMKMIDEINSLRTSPKSYQEKIVNFINSRPHLNNSPDYKKAYLEVISILDTLTPLHPFIHSNLLDSALSIHRGIKENRVSHDSRTLERVQQFSDFTHVGENIVYGSNIEICVIQLLIDANTPGRGHRDNLLSDEFKFIGVRSVNHKQSRVYIQQFAN